MGVITDSLKFIHVSKGALDILAQIFKIRSKSDPIHASCCFYVPSARNIKAASVSDLNRISTELSFDVVIVLVL